MENNIQSASNLLIHIIKLSKINIPEHKLKVFKQTLINILAYKVSIKRKSLDKILIELIVKYDISHEIEYAFKIANISEQTFRSSLPRRLIIVINMFTVMFKIGDKGEFCEIYNTDINSPWNNTQQYRDICAQIILDSPKIPNIALITYNYLNFKTRYCPWDGRRYELDNNPIDINGNEFEVDGYYDLKDTPAIITENEDLLDDFKSFRKWIQKNTTYKYWIDTLDCIYEFLSQLNGDPPSEIFRTHEYYKDDPEGYRKMFQFNKFQPKNNLYWITKYKDFDLISECAE